MEASWAEVSRNKCCWRVIWNHNPWRQTGHLANEWQHPYFWKIHTYIHWIIISMFYSLQLTPSMFFPTSFSQLHQFFCNLLNPVRVFQICMGFGTLENLNKKWFSLTQKWPIPIALQELVGPGDLLPHLCGIFSGLFLWRYYAWKHSSCLILTMLPACSLCFLFTVEIWPLRLFFPVTMKFSLLWTYNTLEPQINPPLNCFWSW